MLLGEVHDLDVPLGNGTLVPWKNCGRAFSPCLACSPTTTNRAMTPSGAIGQGISQCVPYSPEANAG